MKALLFFLSLSAMADAPVFYWKACSIVDGKLSVCGPGGSGDEQSMLKAEKAARKKNELFLREWADGQPVLQWAQPKLWIMGEEQ
ncbi:MAG: hypothetical protein E6R04_07285 [Spirochaetes bacterium]|nr:MAG: hypothetical protein E6R04_07285 [Spirochaetota bacterium]